MSQKQPNPLPPTMGRPKPPPAPSTKWEDEGKHTNDLKLLREDFHQKFLLKGEQLVENSNENLNKINQIINSLILISPEERVMIISKFCVYCGCILIKTCHCMNSE